MKPDYGGSAMDVVSEVNGLSPRARLWRAAAIEPKLMTAEQFHQLSTPTLQRWTQQA